MDNLEPETPEKPKLAQAKATGSPAKGAEATKFLQTMAVWLEGAGDPSRDGAESPLTGWSAQYAANFDRVDEPEPLDLAPVLGLPEGTDREELIRIAGEQEEDLIKQLMA
jgi:hypothetical protein